MTQGGNKIPMSYLKRFLPVRDPQDRHDDLPYDLRLFLDNLGVATGQTRK